MGCLFLVTECYNSTYALNQMSQHEPYRTTEYQQMSRSYPGSAQHQSTSCARKAHRRAVRGKIRAGTVRVGCDAEMTEVAGSVRLTGFEQPPSEQLRLPEEVLRGRCCKLAGGFHRPRQRSGPLLSTKASTSESGR